MLFHFYLYLYCIWWQPLYSIMSALRVYQAWRWLAHSACNASDWNCLNAESVRFPLTTAVLVPVYFGQWHPVRRKAGLSVGPHHTLAHGVPTAWSPAVGSHGVSEAWRGVGGVTGGGGRGGGGAGKLRERVCASEFLRHGVVRGSVDRVRLSGFETVWAGQPHHVGALC